MKIPHIIFLIGLILGALIFGAVADHGGRKMVLLGKRNNRGEEFSSPSIAFRFDVDGVRDFDLSTVERRLHFLCIFYDFSRHRHRRDSRDRPALRDGNGRSNQRSLLSSNDFFVDSFRSKHGRSTAFCFSSASFCSTWPFRGSLSVYATGKFCRLSSPFR